MNIYLKESFGSHSRFTFPSLPESIKVRSGASYQSFSIIGIGEVKMPKGTEVSTVSWNGEFFGRSKRREAVVKHWADPKECVGILSDWMIGGTVLNLVVTGTDINMDVTISEFEHERYGAYGNVRYTVTFSAYRALFVRTAEELGLTGQAEKTFSRSESEGEALSARTHTVVKGDSLWKIARQYYGGSGSDWTRIYEANQDAIEKSAQKHGRSDSDRGHWIYDGEVLTIP